MFSPYMSSFFKISRKVCWGRIIILAHSSFIIITASYYYYYLNLLLPLFSTVPVPVLFHTWYGRGMILKKEEGSSSFVEVACRQALTTAAVVL